jgi:hypothetical protein
MVWDFSTRCGLGQSALPQNNSQKSVRIPARKIFFALFAFFAVKLAA